MLLRSRSFTLLLGLSACGSAADSGAADPANGDLPPLFGEGGSEAGVAPDGGWTGTACAASDAGAPVRVCDVKAYGAKGDGTTKDTKAIQAAIDACATTGGKVTLQGGTYLSGMITLKSNITLEIAQAATLLGSQNIADYPDVTPPFDNTQLGNCKKTLVYAESASNVRITGAGTISSNARGVPDWNGRSKEALRPMAIYTTASKNVTVENVTVKDAATWAVVNMEVDHLIVRSITVSTDSAPRTTASTSSTGTTSSSTTSR